MEPVAAALTFLTDTATYGPLLLAVSGGGDSMALAVAFRAAASKHKTGVHAAIVDHRLRAGSRIDAERAAVWVTDLGIPARILTYSGPPPKRALQETARRLRHELLAREAKRLGASHILLAHTSEDQAETVAFRIARGSGPLGLSSLLPLSWSPVWPSGDGIRLGRPFLQLKRSDLRAFLLNTRTPWLDDPANDDDRFARVRIRARLSELNKHGHFSSRLAEIAHSASEIRSAFENNVWALHQEAAHWHSDGVSLALPVLAKFTPEAQAYLFGALGTVIGNALRLPPLHASQRLRAHLALGKGATLAGAKFSTERHSIRISAMPPRAGHGAKPISANPQRRLAALLGIDGSLELA